MQLVVNACAITDLGLSRLAFWFWGSFWEGCPDPGRHSCGIRAFKFMGHKMHIKLGDSVGMP